MSSTVARQHQDEVDPITASSHVRGVVDLRDLREPGEGVSGSVGTGRSRTWKWRWRTVAGL